MVFFNYATMQMAAKIVYYGPGLCGKTTNLHQIYGKTSPQSRGEMVSLETETDRTLFFDLLPLDVGVIGGFKTRLQLYTVPGQVFYNTTRKLVLKGVDGVVFVADSQRAMQDANVESFKNLEENLAEIGVTLDALPLVLQYNKRDLPSVLAPAEIDERLNPGHRWETFEASAVNGLGVFETLKGISKLTLKSLRKRMVGDDSGAPRRPPIPGRPIAAAAAAATAAPPARPSGPVAAPAPPAVAPPRTAPPPPPPPELEVVEEVVETVDDAIEVAEEVVETVDEVVEEAAPFEEDEDTRVSTSHGAAPTEKKKEPKPAEVVEVEFAQAPAPVPVVQPPVKHVRVRSNIDVLSELEKLRKGGAPAAAAKPASEKKKGGLDELLTSRLGGKKELTRSAEVPLPKGILAKSRRAKFSLVFEDGSATPLHTGEPIIIDLSGTDDADRVVVTLRLDLSSK